MKLRLNLIPLPNCSVIGVPCCRWSPAMFRAAPLVVSACAAVAGIYRVAGKNMAPLEALTLRNEGLISLDHVSRYEEEKVVVEEEEKEKEEQDQEEEEGEEEEEELLENCRTYYGNPADIPATYRTEVKAGAGTQLETGEHNKRHVHRPSSCRGQLQALRVPSLAGHKSIAMECDGVL
ncbi:hypothetical protein QTO34_018273 [Cnephaeus nilssonii]|uniref:Uncharacterized protein n=1 Tax=Cnephaeus nilssonii TaxID=3371016 RepID=A0AA40LPU2_CNENI|nr:hypothetical protein QTO34_018273 [Eptesicus nilssonii]